MEIEKLTIAESIEFLNAFRGCNNLDIFASGNQNGNIYNLTNNGAGGGAFFTAYIWLNNQLVNKWQRYLARYLYMSNSYASTAVNNLTILALGNGLEFQCPNKSKMKRIDKWVKDNKWRQRDIEGFRRFLIDGEIYYRVFGDKVRFVDPDLIYNTREVQKYGWHGVITEEDDCETAQAYIVHKQPNLSSEGEIVPATELQQRANKHFGQYRGFSWLLPVASDLFQADKLTNNLMQTSELLSKIAFWRVHQANKASVQAFRADIHNQPNNLGIIGQNGYPEIPQENIENYPSGSIVDMSDTVDIKFPQALNGNDYNALLDSTLQKVAAHFHLPTGVFNDRSERGAYASELVSSSYIVRSIESIQENWKEFNLQLLEMCGIEGDDITVVCPEVAMIDKKMEADVGDFLLRNKLASRETVSVIFGVDYQAEKEIIEKEDGELNIEDETNENISGSDGFERSKDGGERPDEREDN